MENKMRMKLRIVLIIAGMFAGHLAMNLFNIGVKDGQATALAINKGK